MKPTKKPKERKFPPIPNKYNSPFENEFISYLEPRMKMRVNCKCTWEGTRGMLVHEVDIDHFSYKNREKNHLNALTSNYEKCPKCKRVLFDDGQFIQ